jgi:hypothetical protein
MVFNLSSFVVDSTPLSRGRAYGLVSGLVSETLSYFETHTPELIRRVREHLLVREQTLNTADGRFSLAHSQNLRSAAVVLKHQEEIFTLAFTDALRECLIDEVGNALPQAGFNASRTETTHASLDGTTLSLIDVHEVNRILLLDRVSQSFDTFYEAQLLPLSRCMAGLFDLESVSLTINPFRPIVFLRAFMMAWERTDFDSQATEDLMLSLEPGQFIDVSSLYDGLAAFLTKAGVQPNAYRIRKSPETISAPTPALTPETAPLPGNGRDAVVYTPGTASAAAVDFEVPPKTRPPVGFGTAFQAREFLLRMNVGCAPSGEINADGDLCANPAGLTGQAGASANPVLIAYLGEIQATAAVSDIYHYFGGQGDVGHNVLRQIVNQKEIRQAPEIDRSTVDAMIEIFDYLFAGQGVADQMKTVIGRLQIPVLKAAVIDRGFFLSDEHPARKLVDTLVAASVAWTPERGEQDPLYGHIENAVKRVLTEFENDLTPFSDSLLEFSEFLFETEQHAQKRIDLAANRELEVESLAHADDILVTRLHSLNAELSLAPFLPTFLVTQWRKVIAMEWQQDGANGNPDQVSRAQEIMDQLIWSTLPKINALERCKLVEVLPELLHSLNAGLDGLAWDADERRAFTQRLMAVHTLAIRMNTTPPASHEAVALAAEASQTITRKLERRRLVNSTRQNDTCADAAQALKLNTWFDVTRPDFGHRRCKLSWISPLRTRLLFTNRRGFESFVCSENDVASMLRAGQMRALADEGTPVVSRAIEKLLALNDAQMRLTA